MTLFSARCLSGGDVPRTRINFGAENRPEQIEGILGNYYLLFLLDACDQILRTFATLATFLRSLAILGLISTYLVKF